MTKSLITGSADQNLREALLQEEILHTLLPGDPYRRIAEQNIEFYLDCAAALERGECHFESKAA